MRKAQSSHGRGEETGESEGLPAGRPRRRLGGGRGCPPPADGAAAARAAAGAPGRPRRVRGRAVLRGAARGARGGDSNGELVVSRPTSVRMLNLMVRPVRLLALLAVLAVRRRRARRARHCVRAPDADRASTFQRRRRRPDQRRDVRDARRSAAPSGSCGRATARRRTAAARWRSSCAGPRSTPGSAASRRASR